MYKTGVLFIISELDKSSNPLLFLLAIAGADCAPVEPEEELDAEGFDVLDAPPEDLQGNWKLSFESFEL